MINIYSSPEFSITMFVIYSLGCVLFSFHVIISLAWVVVLFNNFTQLRRKVKHSILFAFNQDCILEALNSKVEYRKSIFLFAIVVSELVTSLLTIAKVLESLEFVTEYYIHNSKNNISNISNHTHSYHNYSHNDCNITHSFTLWGYHQGMIERTVCNIFVIPAILTFSLVYTLMSYCVMVTNKSLNYNTSLQSVDLAREQKILLSGSALTCVTLSLLVMIEQTYLIFVVVNMCVFISQLFITIRYTRKLVRVIKWKILDTKIAFGTNHYLYKSYTKSLRSFKLFAGIYILSVAFFCVFNVIRSLAILLTLTNPYILYEMFGICILSQESGEYLKLLPIIAQTFSTINKLVISISFILLLSLNILTLPYLLSRMRLRCNFKFKYSTYRARRNLREPLLS